MNDDELFAEYLSAETEQERAAAAQGLHERGLDLADLDVIADALASEGQWSEPGDDLEDRIMAGVFGDLAANGSSPVASSTIVRPVASPTAFPASPQPAHSTSSVPSSSVPSSSVPSSSVPSSSVPSSSVPRAPADELSQRRAKRAARGEVAVKMRRTPWIMGVAAALVAGVVFGRAQLTKVVFDSHGSLAATTLAPGASATFKTKAEAAGVRVALDARNLPDPGPNSVYEAWVSDGTIRIPIGTFSKGGRVVLWSGVPLARFPAISVTLEPIDGDPSSSGQVVLRGRSNA